MSRFSYFIFNILLVLVIYTIVYFNSAKHEALIYTIEYFFIPYIAITFLMAIFSLFRFFISHDNDVSKEGLTFLHGTWVVSLMTYIAYKVISTGGMIKLLGYLKTATGI